MANIQLPYENCYSKVKGIKCFLHKSLCLYNRDFVFAAVGRFWHYNSAAWVNSFSILSSGGLPVHRRFQWNPLPALSKYCRPSSLHLSDVLFTRLMWKQQWGFYTWPLPCFTCLLALIDYCGTSVWGGVVWDDKYQTCLISNMCDIYLSGWLGFPDQIKVW